MINNNYLFSEIQKKYGTIQRARKCFLYTKTGARLTDLYQENGRAILGWEGGSAFTVLKNVLNRGLVGSFITEYEYQLTKAIEQLLNSKRKILIYTSYSSALKAALNISADNTNFYRPWNQAGTDWVNSDVVVIAPPLPWTDNLYIVAAMPELLEISLVSAKQIPNSEKIPAPMYASISRSIYNLIVALQERSEKDWFLYDKIVAIYWERKGPYLFPKMTEDEYKSFVFHCLECGLVINPDYNSPSIIPFGADLGVFSKLKNNPFKYNKN